MKDCWVWLYKGAWAEWDIDQIEMAVPMSPDQVLQKLYAIFKHQSQKDGALFQGSDNREFWQRAEDRNSRTAKIYNNLGLAEYEAIEAFVRWKFQKTSAFNPIHFTTKLFLINDAMNNISAILKAFDFDTNTCEIKPLGNGLINTTWVINDLNSNRNFVLQRVNDKVFKQPENIAANIRLISDFLSQNHPCYLFTSPVKALNGSDMIKSIEGEYFRVFRYVEKSVTHNKLQKPIQAYEAARQFGKFTKLLSGIDINQLKITIPDFHNLELRVEQFTDSLKNTEQFRKGKAKEAIKFLSDNQDIVDEYRRISTSKGFKLRVTHHDTKISNVLFDASDKGLCVIDLDTVMPGYFISDVGDMMRTYLSPVSEEEKDFSKIEVRTDFFQTIVKGYLSEMKDELSAVEKKSIFYAGKFMIYMQALRFITDYLNNDSYYGARYEGHNLMRGQNQIVLLKSFLAKEKELSEFISNEI